MLLETERLLVRHYAMTDCDAAFAYLSDSRTMRYIERPYDVNRARSFVFRQCRDKPEAYPVLIKATGELIGHVLWRPMDDPSIYELGWVLGSGHWRQGYGREVGRALIDYGFSQMRIHRVFSQTLEEDEACRALLLGLRFEHEGTLRQAARGPYGWEGLCLYGLLNEADS